MFKRILLPLDLTSRHQRAVETAAEMALQSKGEVALLHVIEEIHGLSKTDEPDFFQKLEQSARDAMDKIAKRLKNRNVACRSLIRYGNRIREVVRAAKSWRSDLIIATGPRFDSEHAATSWASLSWKIGILAPCPVLLVKSS